MTAKEFDKLLDKLIDEYSKEFESWYKFAGDPDIKDYAEVGYAMSRHFSE